MGSSGKARKRALATGGFEITIPIGYKLGLFALLVALTGIYWWTDGDKNVKFFASGVGVAAALLGAVYVGKALENTVEQRTEALEKQQIAQAFRFMERWNDPRFAIIKSDFRKLLEGKIRSANLAKNPLLDKDSDERHTFFEMFNFFEEVALSIRFEVADEETLSRLFRGLVIDFYGESISLIKELRQESPVHRKTFVEFEWVYDRWKIKAE